MKITNLCYKFLQSFLVITLFLTVFCYNTQSNAANYTFIINQNNGTLNLTTTPTFVPGASGLTLERKARLAPDTSYVAVGTLFGSPFDWGPLTLASGDYTFKVSDPLLGIAETHDIVVKTHASDRFIFDYTLSGSNLSVQLLPGTEPFGDGAGSFVNKMTLEYKLASAPVTAYTAINTYNYATQPGSYNLLFSTSLPAGNYNLRATAEYTVPLPAVKLPHSQTINMFIGQVNANPPGGGGFPAIADSFTFDDLSENSGNLLITTTYTGGLPLESVKLFMERPTAPGVWEEVGAITTSPPTTIIWDHLTYPLLADLPSGMYNFKIEGVSYNPSDPSSKFNPFAETPFEVIGSILDITTEELTFGNIGVEVTSLDPTVPFGAVKLYIRDIGTTTWDPVGHFIREETPGVGGPFLWGSKNPSFNDIKLEKLDPGDYTLKAETEIPNPNGPGNIIIEKELDFTVFGTPIAFSYEEVNRDIGLEVIPTLTTSSVVSNISVYIKGLSEPDSAYQLVRNDSTEAYTFGILDSFNMDAILMDMALGTYNAKVELTATGRGDPANYTHCDANTGVTTNCLISSDNSVTPNIVELRYEEVFEFQVQNIVTDPSLVAILDDLYSKEYEFQVQIFNSVDTPSENLNHVGVRLIPSVNVDLSTVQWVNLRIASVPPGMSGATPIIRQATSNNPADWVWGLFYLGGYAEPLLLNKTQGEYLIQSEIQTNTRLITKIESIRISDDVKTDGSLLGDRVGTPSDITIP